MILKPLLTFYFAEAQKPNVTLSDIGERYSVGERVEISCDIVSYPASKVLWSFTPCKEDEFNIFCDESKRVTYGVNINYCGLIW